VLHLVPGIVIAYIKMITKFIFKHLPFFVNPIDQFSFVGSDLNEFADQSDNEEDSDEYQQQQKSSRYGTLTSAKNEGGLTRKTTQDSGYHGSDTHSPAGWGEN